MSPLVSVLVTVYNREKYLAECLDSILASTYADYEVIVVDDRSSDKSAEIARSFVSRDSRVTFHQNDANLGDYGNRLRAASIAQGKYLKYVDADDLIYPHGLEVMVRAMEANPRAQLGISHSRTEDVKPYPWLLTPHESWHKEFLGDGCMGAGPTGAIIGRDAFREIGGFRSWGVLSDTDLWYRMSRRWPIVLLQPGLVWWRRHEDQEFTRDNAEAIYLERGLQLAVETLTAPDIPLTSEERDLALKRIKHRHARRLLSAAMKGRHRGTAIAIIRRSGLSLFDIIAGLRPYW
jgi:glycosyltransferase involved in cell wall biosynthesis